MILMAVQESLQNFDHVILNIVKCFWMMIIFVFYFLVLLIVIFLDEHEQVNPLVK